MVLTDPCQSKYFQPKCGKCKMQDAYYLETSLKGSGSVIIIANDQLRSTTTCLLSFLLEIVCVAVRSVSKTAYHNFENSSFILAVLFLLFTAPVFHDIYLRESKQLKQEFQETMKMYFIGNTCFRRQIVYLDYPSLKKRLAHSLIKPRTYFFKKSKCHST